MVKNNGLIWRTDSNFEVFGRSKRLIVGCPRATEEVQSRLKHCPRLGGFFILNVKRIHNFDMLCGPLWLFNYDLALIIHNQIHCTACKWSQLLLSRRYFLLFSLFRCSLKQKKLRSFENKRKKPFVGAFSFYTIAQKAAYTRPVGVMLESLTKLEYLKPGHFCDFLPLPNPG